MKIATIERQKHHTNFQAGQKIFHNQFGSGIIVGFSEVSDEPVVYFYSTEVQQQYEDRVICVASATITCVQ